VVFCKKTVQQHILRGWSSLTIRRESGREVGRERADRESVDRESVDRESVDRERADRETDWVERMERADSHFWTDKIRNIFKS
jgi:hypothetical protein